jgi:hypothetical protein
MKMFKALSPDSVTPKCIVAWAGFTCLTAFAVLILVIKVSPNVCPFFLIPSTSFYLTIHALVMLKAKRKDEKEKNSVRPNPKFQGA